MGMCQGFVAGSKSGISACYRLVIKQPTLFGSSLKQKGLRIQGLGFRVQCLLNPEPYTLNPKPF